jgi:carboxyl-terminal processing protease
MRYAVAGLCAALALGTAGSAAAATDYGALFDAVWKTVDDSFYDPTFGGRDWKAIGARYRAQLRGVRDDAGFRKVADAMLGELKVSHLYISPPSTSPSSGAGIGVEWAQIEGRTTAAVVAPLSDAWRKGLRPGDRLTGEETALRGPLGSMATVAVQACDGRARTLAVRRERAFWPPAGPAFYWSTIQTRAGARFGYLRVDRFDDGADKLADQAMEALGKTQGLVIDVRHNSGGNVTALRLASYFTQQGELPAVGLFAQPYLKTLGRPVTKADVVNGPKVVGAYADGAVFKAVSDNGGIAVFYTEDLRARRYEGPVAVLIGADTGSAAEGFAWTMRDFTRARLVGRPSAGALLSGETFDLPGGWTLTVPVQGLWGPDGQDYKDKAVPPHEAVALTRADLCAGRDRDLERAMALLSAQ